MVKSGQGQTTWSEFEKRNAPLTQPLILQKSNFAWVYDEENYNLVNDLDKSFDKAKSALGMKINGYTDDIKFVEIPNER